jgi:hypothetical protein
LPDPGTPQARKELLEKIGGKVVTEVQKMKVGGKIVETIKERTEGVVLHWGNENSPDMDWFRAEIKKGEARADGRRLHAQHASTGRRDRPRPKHRSRQESH